MRCGGVAVVHWVVAGCVGCSLCTLHGVWGTRHGGVLIVHGAARPQCLCSLTGLHASSSLCHVAPCMPTPQHRASSVPGTVLSSRTSRAGQRACSAAHCTSPALFAVRALPAPPTRHPAARLGGHWGGSVPILHPPCLAAGPRLPEPLHSAVMDRHAARQSLYSFHV